MFFRKHGLPDESDIVLCTVTRVQYNSVFVFLDEYKIDGLVHISEVSPGRIRNIRDYVKEGKKIVCKVLRVKRDRNQVDLSLRRVSDSQRRNKISELKQEQKAEKIVEYLAGLQKTTPKSLYDEIMGKISSQYEELHTFFQDIVAGEATLSDFKIEKKTAEELEKIVKQRLQPTEVSIKGTLKLTSHAPNGVEIIRDAIKPAITKNVQIKYMGSGNFEIRVTAPEYKEAEEILEKSTQLVISQITANSGQGSFQRIK